MKTVLNAEYYFKTPKGYISTVVNNETGKYDIEIPTEGDYPLDYLRRNSPLLMFNREEQVLGAMALGLINKDVEIIRVATYLTRETIESVVQLIESGEI